MSQHEIFYIVGSYLLGSIPFGFIIYYICEHKDIRKEGSGNIGATNIWRTKGKIAAILTLLLDVFKGTIPIIYGLNHFNSPVTLMMAGAAVILGHLFPVYIKFKGGKGIASLLGVFLVYHWPSALGFAAAFLLVLVFTRYVSAASIAGIGAIFFIITFTHTAEVSTIVLVVMILITVKHSDNLKRVAAGTEDKFTWKQNG
ncbi:MAG: glycerol-3-phosphate 1-O-acyltransferase PlsY [bacterium]|nr:glycerol-3-phosphate 1-O-acyltransferase PlsY [bacterium]